MIVKVAAKEKGGRRKEKRAKGEKVRA